MEAAAAAADPAPDATRDIVTDGDHHHQYYRGGSAAAPAPPAAAVASYPFTSCTSTQSPFSALLSPPTSSADLYSCVYNSSPSLTATAACRGADHRTIATNAHCAAASPQHYCNYYTPASANAQLLAARPNPFPGLNIPPSCSSVNSSSCMESLLSPSPFINPGHDQLFWQAFMNLPSNSLPDLKLSVAGSSSSFLEPSSNLSQLFPTSSCSTSRLHVDDTGFDSGFMTFSQCLQEGMNMDSLDYSSLFLRQLGAGNPLQADGAIQMDDEPLPSLSSALSSASLSQSFGYKAEKSPLILSSSSASSCGGPAGANAGPVSDHRRRAHQLDAQLPSRLLSSSITTVSRPAETAMASRKVEDQAPPGTPISSISNSFSSDGGGGLHEAEQNTSTHVISHAKRELLHEQEEEEQEELGDCTPAHADMQLLDSVGKKPPSKGGGGGGRVVTMKKGGAQKVKRMREARVAFITRSEVEHLEDGFRWRKYGQKAVKNSPHPRSYYRCTNSKCSVKKRVERSSDDPSMVITTYEGQHSHHSPALLRGSAELMLAAAGDGSSHHNLFLNTMQQVALADHYNINPQAPHIMNTPSSPSSAMVPHILDSGEHNVNHDNPYHRPQHAAPFGFPSLSAHPSLSNLTSYNRASNLSNFLPSNSGKTSSDLSMRQENNMHKLSPLSSRAAPRAPTLVRAPGPISSRAESYQTAQDSHTSSDHQGLLEDMVSFGSRN